MAAAVDGGAAYLGFVFYPRSPRYVTPAEAGRLIAGTSATPVKVGLFVDPDDALIAATLAEAPLGLLQLHGAETPERVAAVRARFGLPVMKVLAIAEPEDVAGALPYTTVADRLLFDAKPPRRADALPGGNGLPFDWRLLAGRQWAVPWMLSGGLTVDNLAAAVRMTGADAVDVSSGVEDAPGVKNPARIAAFLAAARAL
ncbi:N-(5'-phosphoribosyl)anthranilate isomerase [Allostella humosa]|nr:N-(5'-phosphoribosyl)anthranilate isomerase [Stella humosa]